MNIPLYDIGFYRVVMALGVVAISIGVCIILILLRIGGII